MAKIPVGKTIRYAYAFTFSHLGAIIALIWLPMVVLALLSFLPRALGLPAPDAGDLTPAQSMSVAAWGLFGGIASLLLSAMAYQAVAELALGLRAPGANYYFSFDMPVWRLLGAIVVFALLLGLFVLLFAGGVTLVGWVSASLSKQASMALLAVAAIVALCLFTLIIFRMGFLIIPVTVTETKIDLARGWTLTYGNFWRIVAVVLAVWAPFLLVVAVGCAIILGSDLRTLSSLMMDTSGQAETLRNALIARHMPMLTGLNLITMPFSMGLGIGASSFAYRALVPPTNVVA